MVISAIEKIKLKIVEHLPTVPSTEGLRLLSPSVLITIDNDPMTSKQYKKVLDLYTERYLPGSTLNRDAFRNALKDLCIQLDNTHFKDQPSHNKESLPLQIEETVAALETAIGSGFAQILGPPRDAANRKRAVATIKERKPARLPPSAPVAISDQ